MFIDHPYIKSARIVTGGQGADAVNTLVLETTVELSRPWYETDDYNTHELMDLLTQLRSFAEHDFADYQAVEIHSPHHRYFARNLGHVARVATT
jgi:hypothetical protein